MTTVMQFNDVVTTWYRSIKHHFVALMFVRQYSLVMSLMASFCGVLFPTRCLGWDLELNWVSLWGYSYLLLSLTIRASSLYMSAMVSNLRFYFSFYSKTRAWRWGNRRKISDIDDGVNTNRLIGAVKDFKHQGRYNKHSLNTMFKTVHRNVVSNRYTKHEYVVLAG